MDRNKKRWIWGILLATAAVIVLTRMAALTYNSSLHPDEHVFFNNTYSLLESILKPGTPFVENKEYPEGAYYFHLPFQLLGKLLREAAGLEGTGDLRYFGRIASVFYFAAGVFLGMGLLRRYLGKTLGSLAVYGLTMCFSLFFIEQSRYGTGDMISMMLVLLLIDLTARAMAPGAKGSWWIGAFFVCGVLGAVKYPQVVFGLIPLAAFLSQPGEGKKKKLVWFLLAVAVGFFAFSPKTILDPLYILRVSKRETLAYAIANHEQGGIFNHLLALLLYLTVYGDLPLLPAAALAGLGANLVRVAKKRGGAKMPEGTERLFRIIVPGVSLFFFAYNLLVPVMFFRTYTPFFAVLTLYTAVTAEDLFTKSKWGKAAVVVLAACMVLRGTAFVWILSDDSKAQETMSGMIASAVDETWRESWYTNWFSFPLPEEEGVSDLVFYELEPLIEANGGMEIQPGQLIVTGAWEYHLGQEYLLPVGQQSEQTIRAWAEFKEANRDYLVGQVYPDAYYYLFGGWLRGGTVSQYEFPCQYLYYRGQ